MLNNDLISIIIPCYNYAHFVGRAIQSILHQNLNCEILVIDNGSTDKLKEVLESFPMVRYFYKENTGVSAARNLGLQECHGRFIVFLDADDWLLPGGLITNYNILRNNQEVAMVIGAHVKTTSENVTGLKPNKFNVDDSFLELLQWNYMEMLGSHMFRTDVVRRFLFDESITGAEDYDLYFKIIREFKIEHNNTPIAAYFFHSHSFSKNYYLMLEQMLKVLNKQRKYITTFNQQRAIKKGFYNLKKYFTILAYHSLKNTIGNNSRDNLDNLIGMKKNLPIWFYHLKWQYPKELAELVINWKDKLSHGELALLNEPEWTLLKWENFSEMPRDLLAYFAKRLLGRP